VSNQKLLDAHVWGVTPLKQEIENRSPETAEGHILFRVSTFLHQGKRIIPENFLSLIHVQTVHISET